MITIHKRQVVVGINKLKLPEHAKVIDFAEQSERLFIWVLLDNSDYTVEREFEILPTGARVSGFYVKTTHMKDETVWHLFENK